MYLATSSSLPAYTLNYFRVFSNLRMAMLPDMDRRDSRGDYEQSANTRLQNRRQPYSGCKGVVLISATVLCGGRVARASIFQGAAEDIISIMLCNRWRAPSLGPGGTCRPGPVHHDVGRLNPIFRPPHGPNR